MTSRGGIPKFYSDSERAGYAFFTGTFPEKYHPPTRNSEQSLISVKYKHESQLTIYIIMPIDHIKLALHIVTQYHSDLDEVFTQ